MFQKNDPFHATAGTPPQRKNEQNLTLITNFKSFSFMKKILLSLLALVAMVVTANAQRAWAYDLGLASSEGAYTFTFKATTAGTATLILTDEEGVEVATKDLGAVVAGENTFTLSTEQDLPKAGKMNWAVKVSGEAIAKLTEVTDQSRGIYDFFNMQGVVVDNNPESEYFGKIYIQQSYEYISGNTTERNKTQKAGIFIYDQQLNELNDPANVGIQPTMPEGYTKIGVNREAFKRLTIDPVTGNLVFGNNLAGEGSVWSISRDNLTGTPTNLISGITEINKAAAICYDKDGSLYVLANITTGSSKYNLYKFTDGEKTELTLKGAKIFVDSDVAMTSDGRGGLWISQRRSGITDYKILSHVNVAQDIVDFVIEAEQEYSDWFSGNCYRAAVAYNEQENLLAVQGVQKISLFNVTYDETTGVPSITKYLQTAVGSTVDGLAFDYAGDLYTINSGSEKFQKFAMPTNNNTCTTPAPKAQVVLNSEQVTYTVTTLVNEEGMGTVVGANNYLAGESATLRATANTGYRFLNWTVGKETLTDNPLTLTVNSDLTVTANFEAIPTYTITANVNDESMGAVEGADVYYEGETVTLTAKPNAGHAFVNWSNDATDNPLVFTATEDVEVTANFEILSYTITVLANDEAKGSVIGAGTYEYGTEVTLTATANEGYEFVNWSNGSTENPLTMTVTSEETLTANFRQVLATSITLNALPVQDYTPAIKGTIKRAVQNGENTIVLTHEADGTAHIYNIAHATQTVIEISQEGVNAAADGYLAISDIAVTDDGKLVACNYVHCTFTPSNTSYFYIWNDLAGDPTVWFTSQKSGNYNDAYMGYTMALKGTSQNAEVTISAFNKSNSNTRYSHLYVVNGEYTDDNYKYSKDNAALHPNTLGKNTYELNASPLAAGNWIVDGELASPIEFVEKNTVAIDTYTALNTDVLGKKYNGVSYLKNYNDHHFMIAPYTNEEGLLAGVKVIGITDGFAAPIVLATNTDLDVAVEATAAAATALVDAEGKWTIHLFADAQVYTFTQKAPEISYETFVLSNLIIEDNESYWLLNASDNLMGLSVMLCVNAEDASIMEGSTILLGETELPILSSEPLARGYNEELAVDTYTARVVVDFMGEKMGLELVMYATLVEPIDLIATDAICVYDETSQILYVNAIWEEKNIQLEIAGVEYVSEKTYGESWLTIAVGEEDEYFVVGEPTVVIDGNTFVLTGKFINYEGKHPDHNVTISGTLPGNLTTALDNIDATVAPVKAIVNGQLVITKDGVQYNAQGAIVK